VITIQFGGGRRKNWQPCNGSGCVLRVLYHGHFSGCWCVRGPELPVKLKTFSLQKWMQHHFPDKKIHISVSVCGSRKSNASGLFSPLIGVCVLSSLRCYDTARWMTEIVFTLFKNGAIIPEVSLKVKCLETKTECRSSSVNQCSDMCELSYNCAGRGKFMATTSPKMGIVSGVLEQTPGQMVMGEDRSLR